MCAELGGISSHGGSDQAVLGTSQQLCIRLRLLDAFCLAEAEGISSHQEAQQTSTWFRGESEAGPGHGAFRCRTWALLG